MYLRKCWIHSAMAYAFVVVLHNESGQEWLLVQNDEPWLGRPSWGYKQAIFIQWWSQSTESGIFFTCLVTLQTQNFGLEPLTLLFPNTRDFSVFQLLQWHVSAFLVTWPTVVDEPFDPSCDYYEPRSWWKVVRIPVTGHLRHDAWSYFEGVEFVSPPLIVLHRKLGRGIIHPWDLAVMSQAATTDLVSATWIQPILLK